MERSARTDRFSASAFSRPVTFQWSLVEGEAGKLFSQDKEDAAFLAPKFDRANKEFIVEPAVTDADQ